MPTRAEIEALDRNDPLAGFRDEFTLPPGVIYLNGNSLGPMPTRAAARAVEAATQEWGVGLIRSWNTAGWFAAPYKLGDRLAQLLGADAGEMVVTDATGLNQFKAVAAACALCPGRRVIVMEGSNFPTNNYMVQGLAAFLGQGHEIRFVEKDGILDAIRDDVAVVALTHVHYKSAHVLDMAAITAKAHAVGALTVWDLCHSAGAIPIDLNAAQADFAVGCTYKYLNGGPGSPAFIFAAKRHHAAMQQPLSGWWGHAAPFAFDRDYHPADGIGRMLTGTQAIVSLQAAEPGIDLAVRADKHLAWAKARTMGDLFITLLEEKLGVDMFRLDSPRDGSLRGGHVALAHPHGYPIMKALIEAGVIGDFRAPDILRFGFSPLYLRYADVADAVDILDDIMARGVWREERFQARDAVT
jgi:kynureninase